MKRKPEDRYLSIWRFYDSVYEGIFGTNCLSESDFREKSKMIDGPVRNGDIDSFLLRSLMREKILKNWPNGIIINRFIG